MRRSSASRGKSAGSRLLLAAALVGGAAAALAAGSFAARLVAEVFGVSNATARLAVIVAGMAAALPAGFYLVERFFIGVTRRNRPP